MKLEVNLPVSGYFTTNRGAERYAIGTELVEVEVPEYSKSELSEALSFMTGAGEFKKTHKYYSEGSKLLKKLSAQLDEKSLLNPHFLTSFMCAGNHPFIQNAFREIYSKTLESRQYKNWGTKNVVPKSLARFLDERYDFSPQHKDFDDLQKFQDLPLKNVNSEIIENQIDAFKEHMKNFILVGREIYQYVPEPVINVETRFIRACVSLCDFEIVDDNAGEFIRKMGIAHRSDISMFHSFSDTSKIEEYIKEEYGSEVPIHYDVSNIKVSQPEVLKVNSAALTALAHSFALARNFMERNHMDNNTGAARYTEFEKVFERISVDEFSLFKDLLNAIDNASQSEITQELDDCIAGIRNLYAPGVDQTSFGDKKSVDRLIEIIDDCEIAPIAQAGIADSRLI